HRAVGPRQRTHERRAAVAGAVAQLSGAVVALAIDHAVGADRAHVDATDGHGGDVADALIHRHRRAGSAAAGAAEAVAVAMDRAGAAIAAGRDSLDRAQHRERGGLVPRREVALPQLTRAVVAPAGQ